MQNDPSPVIYPHQPLTNEELRELYIRFCIDSGFRIPYTRAAQMTSTAAKVLPYTVYDAFGNLTVMEEIANGTHPAAQSALTERTRCEHEKEIPDA